MYLRVFDPDGASVAELADVAEAHVTGAGALVAIFRDGRKYVCNPLCWHDLTEYPDDWPHMTARLGAEGLAGEDQATEPATPVVPGNADEPGLFDGPAAFLSDAVRVHEAMSIVCRCDALRCAVVLNPAAPAEKKARGLFAWKGRSAGADELPEAEPYMRCSWEVGHDVTASPHEWVPGGWPYGPNEHHPRCPRNPENYNNPQNPVRFPREGQQPVPVAEPAGITPEPQSSPVAVMEREPGPCGQLGHPSTSHICLTRGVAVAPEVANGVKAELRLYPPFVLPDHPDTAAVRALAMPTDKLMIGTHPRHAEVAQTVEGGSGAGMPTGTRADYNESACVAWGVCGYWAPEQAPYARHSDEPRKWCTGIPNHPPGQNDGGHWLIYGGGERLQW